MTPLEKVLEERKKFVNKDDKVDKILKWAEDYGLKIGADKKSIIIPKDPILKYNLPKIFCILIEFNCIQIILSLSERYVLYFENVAEGTLIETVEGYVRKFINENVF